MDLIKTTIKTTIPEQVESCFDRDQHDISVERVFMKPASRSRLTEQITCVQQNTRDNKFELPTGVAMVFRCLTMVFMLISCDLPHQPGPMPTTIVETEFEPGLNILGVLRADDLSGSSFININRALTTEEIYSDSIENFSPPVDFVRVVSAETGVEFLFIAEDDSTDSGNYRDSSMTVRTGEVYDLEIMAPGFPTLTGTTIIPEKVALNGNTLALTESSIAFQFQHHASAFQYKLYLIFAESTAEKVIKPSNGDMIDVDWSYEAGMGFPLFLMIAALDENLTRYGNSPISFIPNTYHPDGSTVSGGYGCFGSVSIMILPL
ncbi:MAG: hypothetical protein HQ508_07520 [Candidatus Marinimicrobia bacterium]|nr:hypothetical protein [Candidatus Neomarinimicrobiota bacterium]